MNEKSHDFFTILKYIYIYKYKFRILTYDFHFGFVLLLVVVIAVVIDTSIAVHLTLWHIVFVCHQDVCEDSIGSVYVGVCYGLSGKLCTIGFLVVCKSSSVLLKSCRIW